MFEFNNKTAKIAVTYIYYKLANTPDYISEMCEFKLDTERAGIKKLKGIDHEEDANHAILLEWCSTYLTKKQFDALRAAIRKKLSRLNNRTMPVEIPIDSYYEVNSLAEQAGLTIKDYLIQLITREHKKQKPVFALLKKQKEHQKQRKTKRDSVTDD